MKPNPLPLGVFALLLATVGGLASCDREPRSAAYFVDHRDEAAKVLADCAAGAHRGAECVNAQAAKTETAREARTEAYRRQRRGP